jgi:hypothetical protein
MAVTKCLDILLEPLKRLSKSGVVLTDPWGKERTVFPVVHTYVADDPEAKVVCSIKSSKHPCENCLVPSDKLNAFVDKEGNLLKYPLRLEKDQKDIYASIRGDPYADGKHSTAAVPSPLWGFAFGHAPFGSSTQCFPFESMHVCDLGVNLDIITLIKPYLSLELNPTECAAKLRDINARMREVPRARDFSMPYCDGKYIPEHSRVQAHEHRNVMQVLPFLLLGFPMLQRLAIA